MDNALSVLYEKGAKAGRLVWITYEMEPARL